MWWLVVGLFVGAAVGWVSAWTVYKRLYWPPAAYGWWDEYRP